MGTFTTSSVPFLWTLGAASHDRMTEAPRLEERHESELMQIEKACGEIRKPEVAQ